LRFILRTNYLATLILFLAVCCGSAYAADRTALAFTRYELQATITPSAQAFSAKGSVTLRNDSAAPQKYAVLQISSTLDWRHIMVAGEEVQFLSDVYTTDIDHTGAVNEATITLPKPLDPKQSVTLNVEYGGSIPADAKRLTRIGTPESDALRTDWDQISVSGTAVRGLGFVTWYPVSIDAASLSDGNAVFAALADWRRKQDGAEMHASFCISPKEAGGQVIVSNGTESSAKVDSDCRAYDFRFDPMTVPIFAAGNFQALQRETLTVYHTPDDTTAAQTYAVEYERLEPALGAWVGRSKQRALYVDLMARGAAPYESGSLMLAPLSQPDNTARDLSASYQLSQVSIHSFRPWIDLGLAHFMQFLSLERELGRSNGIKYLQQYGAPLSSNDKRAADDSTAAAQSLINTDDELFYRAKALFVWSMLRDMVGDQALSSAIQSYREQDDHDASYMQKLIESRSKKDLSWFFNDWVYRDRGLPDFHIVSAYPRQILGGQWLVTITIENLGGAAAEVPVMAEVPGGERTVRLLVKPGEKAIARINTQQIPTEIVVNDGSVPENDLTNNSFKIPPPAK
jgi:hypothetical protein